MRWVAQYCDHDRGRCGTGSCARPASVRVALVERGVTFTREPVEQHGQQLAELVGPGGAKIALSSPVAPQAAKPAAADGGHAPHLRFTKLALEAKRHIQQISADELTELRERGPVVVVDVREESEWKQGHLAGALHIPHGVLEADIEQAVPDTEARVVVYCGGGNRSALAAESLQKIGYTRVATTTPGRCPARPQPNGRR